MVRCECALATRHSERNVGRKEDILPLKGDEVAKHASAESCWVIVHGKAYDVTEFLPEHPGGSGIILKYAGQDAT